MSCDICHADAKTDDCSECKRNYCGNCGPAGAYTCDQCLAVYERFRPQWDELYARQHKERLALMESHGRESREIVKRYSAAIKEMLATEAVK